MILRLTLVTNEGNDVFDLIVTGVGTKDTAKDASTLAEEHVSPTHEPLRTGLIENDARVNGRRDLKGDARVNVRLNEARDDVCRGTLRGQHKVNARRASQLRDANDRGLDVLAGNHHEVTQLVDDDDEVRHRLGRILHVGELAVLDHLVIDLHVARAGPLEDLEATIHLGDGPLQGARSLPGLGHDRHIQVRKTRIAGELDALGVNENQTHLLGRGAHDKRHDDRVDEHRLTRACGTGDKHVRHARKVRDDGCAL